MILEACNKSNTVNTDLTIVHGIVLASSPGHFPPSTWPRSEANKYDLAACVPSLVGSYTYHIAIKYIAFLYLYQVALLATYYLQSSQTHCISCLRGSV